MSVQADYSGYFGLKTNKQTKNPCANVTISSQIGLPHLLDTWMTPEKQHDTYVGIHWVEFFLAVKLHNIHVD